MWKAVDRRSKTVLERHTVVGPTHGIDIASGLPLCVHRFTTNVRDQQCRYVGLLTLPHYFPVRSPAARQQRHLKMYTTNALINSKM